MDGSVAALWVIKWKKIEVWRLEYGGQIGYMWRGTTSEKAR